LLRPYVKRIHNV